MSIDGQWISTKDALPPQTMWVLVTTWGGAYDTDRVTWWALYKEGKFYDVLDALEDEKAMPEIEYWMRPPEPAEGG